MEFGKIIVFKNSPNITCGNEGKRVIHLQNIRPGHQRI
jgi:hypothetical protein